MLYHKITYKIKSSFFIVLLSLSLISIPVPIQSAAPAQPAQEEMPPEALQALEELDQVMQQVTREAFRDMHGRDPQSPEELDEFQQFLVKKGEEVIQEAIEEGKKQGKSEEEAFAELMEGLFGEMPVDQQQDQEVAEIEDILPAAPTTTEKKQAANLQELLENLIDIISSFRQKAASDRQMAQNLMPYKYRLDDLIYYLHALNSSELTIILSKPEHQAFRDTLDKLHDKLATLDAKFNVPEYKLIKETIYKLLNLPVLSSDQAVIDAYTTEKTTLLKTKETTFLESQGLSAEQIKEEQLKIDKELKKLDKAYTHQYNQREASFVYEEIINVLDQVFDNDTILKQMSEILKQYEPEAEKKLKERETLEKDARTYQEKMRFQRTRLWPKQVKKFTYPEPKRTADYGYDDYDDYDYDYNDYAGAGKTPLAEGHKADKGKSAPGKKKADKKDKKDKDKKKDATKKDKKAEKAKPTDKKRAKKKDAGKPKLDKKVSDQLIVLEDMFLKPLQKSIEDKADAEYKLKNFCRFLTQGLNPTNADQMAKVTGYKNRMDALALQLSAIKDQIKKVVTRTFKDKPELQEQYKQQVKEKLNKMEQEKWYKDSKIDRLLRLKPRSTYCEAPINPMKQFIFFGHPVPGWNIFPDNVKAFQADATTRAVKIDEVGQPVLTNVIDLAHSTFEGINKDLASKKKRRMRRRPTRP